jgi:hypothetical protein
MGLECLGRSGDHDPMTPVGDLPNSSSFPPACGPLDFLFGPECQHNVNPGLISCYQLFNRWGIRQIPSLKMHQKTEECDSDMSESCPKLPRNSPKSQHIPTIPRPPASGHPHPHPWPRMAAPTRDTPPAPRRRRRWDCPTQRTTRDRHSQPDVGGHSQLERRDQSSLPALRLHLAENPLSFP